MKAISTLRAARALSLAAVVALGAAGAAHAQTTGDAMVRTVVPMQSMPSENAANPITFSGQVTIASRLALDRDFGKHKLILVVDMTGLVGKLGKTTFTTTYREVIEKPHAPTQSLEFPFPVTVDNAAPLAATVTGTARFALNVDPATGAITSASGTVAGR